MEQVEVDNVVLATLVTILLIRAGGQLNLSAEEWLTATNDNGSLWVSREGPDQPVRVVLMRSTIQE